MYSLNFIYEKQIGRIKIERFHIKPAYSSCFSLLLSGVREEVMIYKMPQISSSDAPRFFFPFATLNFWMSESFSHYDR